MKLKAKSGALKKAMDKLKPKTKKLGTVLIIDDEQANVDGLARFLENDYRVLSTTDPHEAVRIGQEETIDVILSDQRMPGLLGTEVLSSIKETNPDNVRMILTGYTDINDLIKCINTGLIYRYLVKPWNPEELRAVVEEALNKIKAKRTMDKLVPQQIWNQLYAGSPSDVAPGDGREVDCTILFLDIRRFTTLAETMSPKEAFSFLTSYMGWVSPIVEANQGYVDKYLGDGIMAIFDDEDESAKHAIRCSIELVEATRRYNEKHRTGELPEFRRGGELRIPVEIGVGLKRGKVMLGTVGFARRLEFTVLGDTVNTASRIQDLTKRFGANILIDEETFLNSGCDVRSRLYGAVRVRGKHDSIRVCEIFEGDMPERVTEKARSKAEFENAVNLGQSSPEEASRELREFLKNYPGDTAAESLFEQFVEATE